jgi:SAM-dependent methyltransferase
MKTALRSLKRRLNTYLTTPELTPPVAPGLGGLPYGRGHFDTIEQPAGPARIRGWLLAADQPLDAARLLVNGLTVATVPLTGRSDIPRHLPWIAHAGTTAFEVIVAPDAIHPERFNHLDVVGLAAGRPVVRMDMVWRPGQLDAVPVPPPDLMKRILHGAVDQHTFAVSGMKTYGEFSEAIRRHWRESTPPKRLLDWGCGSGRVVYHFLRDPDRPSVTGSDVDAEAIAWCQKHLPAATFAANGMRPPLPFAADAFDVVVAHSVFTHLDRQLQREWLADIRRVLRPGGLFVTSAHGPFAARFTFPPETAALVQQRGIRDDLQDRALDGVVAPGYYRSTFQTPEYTCNEWGRQFEVLEYVEGGMQNFQDLVVLRRPG